MFLMLLGTTAFSGLELTGALRECQRETELCPMENDMVSLLQVSMTASAPSSPSRPARARIKRRASATSHALPVPAELTLRRAQLKVKIVRVRASLKKLEAELASLDRSRTDTNQTERGVVVDQGSTSELHVKGRGVNHIRETDVEPESNHTMKASSSSGAAPRQQRWSIRPRLSLAQMVALRQQTSQHAGNAMERRSGLVEALRGAGAGASAVWIGSVLYKYGVTQAFAEGTACPAIPGVQTIGGPSGLPDYLAYFIYQVTQDHAGMATSKQIEKVSQAFKELLPESPGDWHTFKIELDMQGSECMVQDKVHFSSKSAMCHVGIVWSGDDAKEFWIVSYGGDGNSESLLETHGDGSPPFAHGGSKWGGGGPGWGGGGGGPGWGGGSPYAQRGWAPFDQDYIKKNW